MARILLAQSLRLLRPFLRSTIEEAGHTVEIADSAQEVVRILTDRQLDLLVLDLDGPRCGGLSLVNYLRRPGFPRKVKVLGLSARRDRAFLVEAAKCGLSGLLLKEDSDPAALLGRIAEMVKPVAAGASTPAPGAAPSSPGSTGSSTPAAAMPAAPPALKPFEIEALLPRITNATALRPVVHQVIAMAGNPNIEMDDLVGVVRNDVGLSAKVIAAANSAFYRRRSGSARHLAEAIATIGMQGTRELAMSLAVSDHFKTDSSDPLLQMPDLWGHSVACAHLCELLARQTKVCDAEQAFIVGLLHDLGRRVMSEHLRAHYRHVLHRPLDGGVPLQEIERTVVGIDHASLGADVLQQWGCPAFLTRAVKLHHSKLLLRDDFADPLAGLLRVLVMADAMAIAFGFAADAHDELPQLPRGWLKTLEGADAMREMAFNSLQERLGVVMSRADLQINMPLSWPGALQQIVLLGATVHPLEPLQLAMSHAYQNVPMQMPAKADPAEAATLVLADLRAVERRQDLPAAVAWLSGRRQVHHWPVLLISNHAEVSAEELGLQGHRVATLRPPIRPAQLRTVVERLLPEREGALHSDYPSGAASMAEGCDRGVAVSAM
jgi:putative nucleotidyltransferase with HDIG domain